MQALPVVFAILTIFNGLSHTLGAEASSQPYCYINITETSQKMVTKTRLKTVNKKGLFNKLAQRKETQVEVYEDYEPVVKTKVERVCCEGYKRTELDMCEPECIENGCPAHSKCVEPEVCECVKGYFSARSATDDKHYCEPICEKTCPEHSICVAPNECACKKGFKVTDSKMCEPYCAFNCPKGGKCVVPNKCQCPEGFKLQQGACLPLCSFGHQCQNGSCLDDDICKCNDGFTWNYQTLECETIPSAANEPDFEVTNFPTDVTQVMDFETVTDTYGDEIDPSQVFDEFISTTTSENDGDYFSTPTSVHKQQKCPDDFVFHEGECKPLKFASNEIDCHFKPCQDKHSYCLENGTCACNEGYQWFKIHVKDNDSQNHTIKSKCLTTAEFEMQKQMEDQEQQEESTTTWGTIVFIILGVSLIASALIFLSLKLMRTQTGRLDVEGKNLACSYDHRACTETEKSVI